MLAFITHPVTTLFIGIALGVGGVYAFAVYMLWRDDKLDRADQFTGG